MNLRKLSLQVLLTIFALGSVSSSLPEPEEKDLGPKSEHSSIPWNRRLPGEGQGMLGGFSQ